MLVSSFYEFYDFKMECIGLPNMLNTFLLIIIILILLNIYYKLNKYNKTYIDGVIYGSNRAQSILLTELSTHTLNKIMITTDNPLNINSNNLSDKTINVNDDDDELKPFSNKNWINMYS